MTKFLDGPAAGVVLRLERAPLYLRVVRNGAGKWDALDKIDDEPEKGEKIFVYVITGSPGRVHVYGSKVSGWFAVAEYKAVEDQPADHEVRETAAWQRWARAQPTPQLPPSNAE